MADATDQERRELARRASSRRSRRIGFTPARPTKWNPGAVRSPIDGQPFTLDGSWNFIADAINGGGVIEVIFLRKPPGKRAFVMLLDGVAGVRIYVKLEFLSDIVLGRSFHESVPGGDEDE